MKKKNNYTKKQLSILGFTGISMAVATLVACSNQGATTTDSEAISAKSQPSSAQPSGAQLWSNNCARCHNFRDPSSYSDKQWEIAGLHMRTRANLTGGDYRKILEFLKNSN